MKLAEALLLRKQLVQKVEQLKPIKQVGDNGLFELKHERRNVNETTDEIKFQIPKVTLADVTKTFDHYATQLRKLDSAIQRANWETEISFVEEHVA